MPSPAGASCLSWTIWFCIQMGGGHLKEAASGILRAADEAGFSPKVRVQWRQMGSEQKTAGCLECARVTAQRAGGTGLRGCGPASGCRSCCSHGQHESDRNSRRSTSWNRPNKLTENPQAGYRPQSLLNSTACSTMAQPSVCHIGSPR